MLAPPIPLTHLSCWLEALAFLGERFALPSVLLKTSNNSLQPSFSLPIAIWTSTPSFADMAMLSEDFNAEAWNHPFLL